MPVPTKQIVRRAALMLVVASEVSGGQATGQRTQRPDTATKIDIYGFVQADAIADFKTNNADWFDVNRPSELPKTPGEFGHDGHTWFSARQARFGTKATIPISAREIAITFEWDLFGVGPDAGQTTIRPRLMYGQLGDFGGGQPPSPFTDPDVRPRTGHSRAKRLPISASWRSSIIGGTNTSRARSGIHASTSTTAICKRRRRSRAVNTRS